MQLNQVLTSSYKQECVKGKGKGIPVPFN